MVTKDEVAAALQASEEALAAVSNLRQERLQARAAEAEITERLLSAREIYDAAHLKWMDLRKGYLEERQAEAAQTLGGDNG